ncbi:hypothetical protein A3D77_05380 [Candidatus Gottesmanbacteria bacterium RIFCSPHIGHO2_02_FULL_39_11]|uniref:Uncharacterized protein n=1 Tax=Candidatus Gottesmanbacteria bacterium RIFCSPHIGHO2_02_FULL_39_11 TaxID=1798382 RepID=A0A1F5ZL97_9BACT|nr:MAG: hypothetical protein A3D77_05380 [Candidatus Gottesmanbacteria bacterium RIFCSPHIGHO2_02_FULL_39_11]
MVDQSDFLYNLTPEQRLEQACSMSDFSRELTLGRIKTENPESSESQLQEMLIKYLHGNIWTKRSSSLSR